MFGSNQGQRVYTIIRWALLFLIFGLVFVALMEIAPINALNGGNPSSPLAVSSMEAATPAEAERPQGNNLQDGASMPTNTPTPTSTSTVTPTSTDTPSPTDTPTPTNTPTPTSTSTVTPTSTDTPSPTPTPFVDLSSSTKHVDKNEAAPGEVLTYTITLTNTGNILAEITVFDGLPSDVIYNEHLQCSRERCEWVPGENAVQWIGTIPVGTPVTITYQVKVKTGLPEGTVIANTARIQYGGVVFDTVATMTTVKLYRIYLPLVMNRYYYCIPPSGIFEPNDRVTDAQGPLCRDAIYEEYINSEDDEDFYYIWISQNGTVRIELTNIPQGTDYDLFLYDGDVNKVAQSRNFGQEDERIVYQVRPGKYYIRVFPFSGYSTKDPYRLKWTFY